MNRTPSKTAFGILLALSALYATSLYSYLLFHCLVEIFSIVIACGIFMIAWNTRRFADNNYLLFLGIAYLFVGFFDLLHTLAYRGMGVFPPQGANLATQLWIASRYLESLSLLAAPVFIAGRPLHPARAVTGYLLATAAILFSIFFFPFFPDCYIEGSGLTPFKRTSEVVISFLLGGAALHLLVHRKQFHGGILRLLLLSIALTILAELAFIFYVGVYDLSNMVGHFFKFLSFYLLYVAMIRVSLVRPYDILFNDLSTRKTRLEESNRDLQVEIKRREQTENRLRKINEDLTLLKQTLEGQLDEAFAKRNELTRRLSELVLKNADHSQAQIKERQRLQLAETENRELREQLSYYFEALMETNRQIAKLYDKNSSDG